MTKVNEVKSKKPRRGQYQAGDEILDELLKKHGSTREGIFGVDGIVPMLTKRLVERALRGELTHHLGYEQREKPREEENYRNGYSKKTLLTKEGSMEVEIPRDRKGDFEPVIITKGEKRFKEFDERIISMYAGGMTIREIQTFLEEHYDIELSPDFISTVTDSVNEDVKEWQNRPLDPVYPIVLFDALRVKIRDEGTVKNKAVYIALGTNPDGIKEVLGIWVEQNEGAKFWMKVMNDLRNRGVKDILIAVVDGLNGFPEAITSIFPETTVQTCIVHLIRNNLAYCNWKERKAVAQELKKIYQSATVEAAEARLREFEESSLGKRFPMIGTSWRKHWDEIIPFFSYSPGIRKIMYTTNAIESLNMQLRKVLKTRGHFPNDEAAVKLMYLALRRITKKWLKPPMHWSEAARQFAIQFGERFKK
jgi:transposase-like protein